LLQQGNVNVVGRWLRKLPSDLVHSRPKLSVFYAWMLLSNLRLEEIVPYLQSAEQHLSSATDVPSTHRTQNLHGELNAIKAFLVRVRGDAPAAIDLYQQALAQITDDNIIMHGVILVDLGRAYVMIDELACARQALEEAIALNKSIGYYQMALYGTSVLGEVEVNQGLSQQAMARYQQIVKELEAKFLPLPPVVADLYASLSQLYREWDDLEAATAYAEKAIALCEERNFPDGLFQRYLALGQIQEGRGEFVKALEHFQAAERIIQRSQTAQWTVSITAYQARLWARRYLADGDARAYQAALG
ncbi:MAG: hypothetical protein KDE53_40985, partial [Caldilineaceae bacterium]|nr:hypothetical protein [Caldilineaceae bacterium]